MNKIACNKQYLLKLTTVVNAKNHLFTLSTTKINLKKLCERELYKPYTIFVTSNTFEFCIRMVARLLVFLRRSLALVYMSHIHT
jgi:hypothetical protein